MKKGEIYIDLNLQDPNCTMLCPGYIYLEDKDGFRTRDKKERDPDNLLKLEHMISIRMQKRYQEELLDTLNKNTPILYIDCSQKGEDDIMLFILKEYIKQSQAHNKNNIVSNAIGRHTIVTENKEQWDKHIKENNLTLDEILHYYSESLKILLQENTDEERRNRLLNFESDITFNGLGQLMEDEGRTHITLYLDRVQSLSIEEQQRINMLLFTRGNIPQNKRIRLKINDGQGSWKTWRTMSGHRTEATHDYSEITIRENELE